jgi:hypothetical protein
MLLKGVYDGNNGGYAMPGETIWHCESLCPEVLQSFGEMEWVRDRTGFTQCDDCLRLGAERSGARHL